jgi:NTP pyrophosphatase (non-canonical NTP hydrolase)
MERFEKVYIKSKADWPEKGTYFCCRSGFMTIQELDNNLSEKSYMREIDWYLRPIAVLEVKEVTDELQILMDDISEWSDKQFGEYQRNPAIAYHLLKETRELIEAFERGVVTQEETDKLKMEFADCFMLILDSATHAFLTADDLLNAASEKLEINKKREWGKPDINGVVEHISAQSLTGEQIEKPKIICICGSGRFLKEMHEVEERLTLERKIVLMIGVNTKDVARTENLEQYKPMLDELHLRKIDLADEIFIINKDGYIGESTRNEIDYAIKTGKPVNYLEPCSQVR